jgi:pilus assembly protein CpaD
MGPRTRSFFARGVALALAAGAAACTGGTLTSVRPTAELPSEKYGVTVRETRQKLEIPTVRDKFELTFDERAAIEAFGAEHVARGHGFVTIALPGDEQNTTEEAVVAAADARDILYAQGIAYADIRGTRYDSAGRPDEPIVLFFTSYEAQAPECHKEWRDFNITWSGDNTRNFGCASQANLAAMIADPRDLLGPRPEDDPDPLRRGEVLDKYRRGETTITNRDSKETVTVSDAVE